MVTRYIKVFRGSIIKFQNNVADCLENMNLKNRMPSVVLHNLFSVTFPSVVCCYSFVKCFIPFVILCYKA